jgi:hypothetical protein
MVPDGLLVDSLVAKGFLPASRCCGGRHILRCTYHGELARAGPLSRDDFVCEIGILRRNKWNC